VTRGSNQRVQTEPVDIFAPRFEAAGALVDAVFAVRLHPLYYPATARPRELKTTAIYTEVTIRQLQEVHARCHPSGRVDTPDLPTHPP